MKKQIAILFGSPRTDGYTAQMVKEFLSKFDSNIYQVTCLYTYKLNISPCTDCRACLKGLCPFNKKDDYAHVLEVLQQANLILLASPIYFFGFPAPLKTVLDRSQQFFQNRAENRTTIFPHASKAALFLCSGVAHPEGMRSAELAAKMFFKYIHADFLETVRLENTDKKNNFTLNFSSLLTKLNL